jgi:hypothetical protein
LGFDSVGVWIALNSLREENHKTLELEMGANKALERAKAIRERANVSDQPTSGAWLLWALQTKTRQPKRRGMGSGWLPRFVLLSKGVENRFSQ